MFKYLEKLRKEGEGKRRRIAFSIALGITLIVFFVWSVVFLNSKSLETGYESPEDSIKTPFETVFGDIKERFNQFKNDF